MFVQADENHAKNDIFGPGTGCRRQIFICSVIDQSTWDYHIISANPVLRTGFYNAELPGQWVTTYIFIFWMCVIIYWQSEFESAGIVRYTFIK